MIDALEQASASLDDVRLHQMLAMRSRPYIDGQRPNLRHVSWFLSPANREAFPRGDCDLVPNSFSDVPRLMRQALAPRLVLASVSEPDRHGYFSLGTDAEYAAAMIGEVPFFVEVNARMPGPSAPTSCTSRTSSGSASRASSWWSCRRRRRRAGSADRRTGRRADPRRRDAPGRHRRGPDLVLDDAVRPPRARRAHRAVRRRDGRSGRGGGDHRHAQAHPSQQDRDDLGARPPAAVRLRRRQPGSRVSSRSTTPTIRATSGSSR